MLPVYEQREAQTLRSIKYRLYIEGFAIERSICYFEGLICSTVRENRGFFDQLTNLTYILVAFTRLCSLSDNGNAKQTKWSFKRCYS